MTCCETSKKSWKYLFALQIVCTYLLMLSLGGLIILQRPTSILDPEPNGCHIMVLTYSKAFSWKMYIFLQFSQNLYRLTIRQHWFMYKLDVEEVKSHQPTQWRPSSLTLICVIKPHILSLSIHSPNPGLILMALCNLYSMVSYLKLTRFHISNQLYHSMYYLIYVLQFCKVYCLCCLQFPSSFVESVFGLVSLRSMMSLLTEKVFGQTLMLIAHVV